MQPGLPWTAAHACAAQFSAHSCLFPAPDCAAAGMPLPSAAGSPCGILALPEELLAHVFARVDLADRCIQGGTIQQQAMLHQCKLVVCRRCATCMMLCHCECRCSAALTPL